jgi:hypothetical protein
MDHGEGQAAARFHVRPRHAETGLSENMASEQDWK